MDAFVSPGLNVDMLRRIDSACDQFEEAWRSGAQPRIEDYVSPFQAEARDQLLEQLQQLQQELVLIPQQAEALAGNFETGPSTAAAAISGEQLESNPAQCTSARVVIEVTAGPHAGMKFEYSEHGTLLVGRSAQAQLRLQDDPRVSRHHLRLEIRPPTCFLLDLNSSNGTCVNQERVTERFLTDEDVVTVGRTSLSIRIPQMTPAASHPTPQTQSDQSSAAAILSGASLPAAERSLAGHDVPAAEGPSAAPEIPGYELCEQIAIGELGVTFRARQVASGAQCAVKVIRPEAGSDEHAVRIFLREASALKQLRHRHIIRLLDQGCSGSDVYFVTEYLETISWEDLAATWTVERRIRAACALATQILGALDHAHIQGMVHRDVKPANLLITRRGGKLVSKLADFGLAKRYTSAGMSRVTRSGDVIGSLSYISPEQFINARHALPACDIYAIGATLYWLITGEDPISLDEHPCKFLAVLEAPPIPLQTRCPQVSSELAAMVHRALEKNPGNRWSSAAEFRDQLLIFLDPRSD